MERENQRLEYLKAMGIQLWVRKAEAVPIGAPMIPEMENDPKSKSSRKKDNIVAPPETSTHMDLPPEKHAIEWNSLKQHVSSCIACGLHQSRTQTVFGVGDAHASWMAIGEAPGAHEDRQGEPFVGRAGVLLNEMFRALGLKREEVFITNILKCRPPNNRDPEPEEAAACETFLKQQVNYIKPKIILAVGRVAAQNLLKTDAPIGKLRAKLHYYQDIPVVVLYHPAYLLRSPLEKRRAWDDLRFALTVYKDSNNSSRLPVNS